MAKTTRSSLPALALSAVAAGVTAAPARVGGGRQGAPTAASIWSSPGSHGVLDEEEEEDAEDEASHFADLDLAASWGAAVEAAVAGLASPSTAPSSLAILAADPHAPADLCESPTAWAGLVRCLPRLLSDTGTADAAAALVAAVASTAAAEAPALLPALAVAAVGGLESGGGACPAAAVACVTTLLSHTLPRAWATFTPPILGVAVTAVARATAREPPGGTPAPALLALASFSPPCSAAWLRRWAATPRVGAALWEALGKEQVGLHERAVVVGGRAEGGGGDGALPVSTTLIAAALSTRAGRAGVSAPAAAALALARLCGSARDAVADAARSGVTALAGCVDADATPILPPAALLALVEAGVSPALAALATTPAGVDALLRAVVGSDEHSTPWPHRVGAPPLPPAVAGAVGRDPLGALHLLSTTRRPTPGALAAAAASRTPTGLVALTQAGADPAAMADAWLEAGAAWVPPGPAGVPSPAWAVCAAAAALVALHPVAVGASVAAAIAGVPPALTWPPTPLTTPAEDVAALFVAHGSDVARLLVD